MNQDQLNEHARDVLARAAIREAFENLLHQDWRAAQRALAQAQVQVYGLRPWRHGVPTRDACDNGIVFRDSSSEGCRYTVSHVQSTGAHVRVLMGHARDLGPFDHFEAWGLSSTECKLLASVFASERRVTVSELVDCSLAGADKFVVMRFRETK